MSGKVQDDTWWKSMDETTLVMNPETNWSHLGYCGDAFNIILIILNELRLYMLNEPNLITNIMVGYGARRLNRYTIL